MWVLGMIATMLVAPGGEWREIETGVPGELTAITSPGYGSALAVGATAGKPLLMTWAKHQWTPTTLPLPRGAMLTDVSAAAKNDADIAGFAGATPLSLHWDGKTWTSRPFARKIPGFPRAVDGVWMAGSTSGVAGSEAAIWHWDGKAWSETPVPGGFGSGLAAIDGATAVGTRGDQALIVHWDGLKWADETPDLGPDVELTDVAGDYAVGSFQGRALVLHRESGEWKVAAAPEAPRLVSVALDGQGGVWASCPAGFHHYEKAAWTHTHATGAVRALALTRGTSFLWAAGDAGGKALTWTTAPRPR